MSLTPPETFLPNPSIQSKANFACNHEIELRTPSTASFGLLPYGPGRHQEEIEEPQKPVRTSRAEPSPGPARLSPTSSISPPSFLIRGVLRGPGAGVKGSTIPIAS